MSTGTALAFNILSAELIAVGIGHQNLLLILCVVTLAWIQSGYRVRSLLGQKIPLF
jgi:hypothetical protein